MKNLFFKSILCFTVIFGFLYSCNDDDSNLQKEDNSKNKISLVTFNVSQSNSNKGEFSHSRKMLSFETLEDYENTIEMLENQIEAHEDAFISQYSHLSDDELDDLEESIGFDAEAPLKEFENRYNFSNSMRVTFNQLEEQWLNNEELDDTNDPTKDLMFDAVERALWNNNQEVMIAGKVYAFSKPNYAYEITNDYEASLNKIENNEDVSNNPNINSYSKTTASCTTWKSKNDFKDIPNSNNRRVKRIVTIRSVPFVTKTKAEIISYKKKRNRWKRSRSSIGVALQIYLKNKNCNQTVRQGYKYESIKKRRSRTVRMFDWGNSYAYKAANGQSVIGQYYYGNTSSSKVLSW